MWLVHDSVELEKLSIPTITIVTTEFVGLAKTSALSFGVADMCLLTVPHPFAGLKLEEIEAKADATFPEILKSATEWKPTVTKLPLAKPPYPAERIKFKGTVQDVNRMFFEKGWSEGLPIIPPTPERVAEMLKGTTRRPDEVLWVVPSRNGILTTELLATYAVMAGCKPEYMPVLLGAIECFKDPQFNWRGARTTTSAKGVILIVNGPIVKEIGLGYGQGAAGPGYHANLSIGYALSLIDEVIAGGKKPNVDKSVLASALDIVFTVVGENEDANPWQPYHVEKGFKERDNVIMARNTDGLIQVNDVESLTGEAHLGVFIRNLSITCFGIGDSVANEDIYLILCPERAALFAKESWTKEKIRQFIYENARIPYWMMPGCKPPKEWVGKYGPITPDTKVPMLASSDEIHIFVIGGSGTHSAYFKGFPRFGRQVTKRFEK